MWSELDNRAKMGLLSGVVILVILTIVLIAWMFMGKQEVLFSNMDEKEAANVISALEDMKVPYSLQDNGSTVLVDSSQVQSVRVKLVGQGVSLNAGSGFELFDDADIGMTEYSQKINYLRAMQGELARSIMSIDGIKYARVHLVLPETSLFRQKKQVPTASVTLVPEKGVPLTAEQILGIQRLVAAAAPGINQEDVTVIDNNGITLSTVNPALNKENITTLILQKKREAERYLENKVNQILDKTFGADNAIATISVELAVDKVHRKEEVILPNSSRDSGVLRKRESTSANPGDKKGASPRTVELEYELSRRVEEIVSMPGAIKRISVGVVVPEGTDEEQLAHLQKIISMSVGLDESRGDDLAVYPMKTDMISHVLAAESPALSMEKPGQAVAVQDERQDAAVNPFNEKQVLYALGGMAAVILILLLALLSSMRSKRERASKALSPEERDRLLGDIKHWLNSGEAA
jgi:flagellar M-ring protein FliF